MIAAKLRRPLVRPGTVRRPALIERLAEDARPVVSVMAPPGYGKTTLLSQWAESSGLAFAWVSIDEADNDPRVLLTYIAEALDGIEPIGDRVFAALAAPGSSVPGSVVPRLASAFLSVSSSVVLVLDDVHALHYSECRAALSVLAEHVPDGSRLVLAGQTEPPLRVARLRAEDRILEIGPGDLSLTRAEAASLLRRAGVTLTGDEVAVLHQRTEGWPAGLYLAALYLREGGSLGGGAVSFAGDDRLVSEYMESELLTRITEQERVFLTRTSVLERLSGPLCEAVLGQPGAAAVLAPLARSNLLLVPLDRQGKWYRYHQLFRDMLLAELHRRDQDLIPVLRRRAAAWCLRNDRAEEALEYFMAAGDIDAVARLVAMLAVPAYQQGRVATIQRWFGWLDTRGGMGAHPMTAVLAALASALTSRPADAERWADAVDRWQHGDVTRAADPSAEAWAAALRALLCRDGADRMRADADEAAREFAAQDITAPLPALLQGLARVLSGDLDGGDAAFQAAAGTAEHAGGPEVIPAALAERSLIAMARGDWDRAEALAGRARAALRQAGMEDSYIAALVCATDARLAIHHRDFPAARRELVSAQRLRPLLTYALPHLAVQTRIELIRVCIALADLTGARTLMQETSMLLRRRPSLGTLASEAEALRTRLASEHRAAGPASWALTGAELRLLPMLSTHLSLPEIAREMFVSRNTIRSQAFSIYRKLGASSRNQAVTRARDLGLLEGPAPSFAPEVRERTAG